jgi:hypothetical protein
MRGLVAWPTGMRPIVGEERPHSGAQLCLTDLNDRWLACSANTTGGQLADLVLRYPQTGRREEAPVTPACAT